MLEGFGSNLKIPQFQCGAIEHIHTSPIGSDIIFPVEITAGHNDGSPQTGRLEYLEPAIGLIDKHEAVARTYQFLTSMKGNGTNGHVSGIKQILILIGGKQVALEQGVVYPQLVKANP